MSNSHTSPLVSSMSASASASTSSALPSVSTKLHFPHTQFAESNKMICTPFNFLQYQYLASAMSQPSTSTSTSTPASAPVSTSISTYTNTSQSLTATNTNHITHDTHNTHNTNNNKNCGDNQQQKVSKNIPSAALSPWYHQMVAGAGAGAVAAVFVSPLDVMRLRMQTTRSALPPNTGLFGWNLLRDMVQVEGPRSLFKGLGANLIALMPNWASYFIAYSFYRKVVGKMVFGPNYGQDPSLIQENNTQVDDNHNKSSKYKHKHNNKKITQQAKEPVKVGAVKNTLFDVSSAVFAGFTTFIVTNPLWLVKSRLQVQGLALRKASDTINSTVNGTVNGIPNGAAATVAAANGAINAAAKAPTSTSTPVVYRGTFHALKTIYQTEGFLSLYRGLVPQMFGLLHVGIHFPLYESCKRFFLERNVARVERRKQIQTTYGYGNEDENDTSDPTCHRSTTYTSYTNVTTPISTDVSLSTTQIVLASMISKLVACLIAYPHEVLRSRFQTQHYIAAITQDPKLHVYSSVADAMKRVYRDEGIRGFYKGLPITLLRSIPACIVTFVTYEKIIYYLSKVDSKKR